MCPKSIRPALRLFFFDCEGVVHYEFAPRGQTINKEYYVKVLKRLRNAVRRKRPRFWSSGDWLLHHDNAPAHSSNLVQQFMAKHKIVQLRQPPYSPDMAPCDFCMFSKFKMALKGKQFDDIETIQSNATRELKAIPKSAFEDCFKMWKHRWERVVQSNEGLLRRMPRSGWRRIAPTRRYERRSDTFRTHLVCPHINP